MVEVAGGTKVSPAPLPLYEFRKGGTPSNKTDKKGGSRDSRKKGAIWEDLKMAMERVGGRGAVAAASFSPRDEGSPPLPPLLSPLP